MESMDKKVLFWERLRTWLTLGILTVLIVMSVGLLSFTQQLRHYETRAEQLVERLDDVTQQLTQLDWETMVATVNGVTKELDAADVAGTLAALNEISAQLREVDWEKMSGDVEQLVLQAQESLAKAEEALSKAAESMDALDIETLNDAIADLRTVVEPLAALAEKFK